MFEFNDVVSMELSDICYPYQKLYIQFADILHNKNRMRRQNCFKEEEPVYVWGDEFKTEEVFYELLHQRIKTIWTRSG